MALSKLCGAHAPLHQALLLEHAPALIVERGVQRDLGRRAPGAGDPDHVGQLLDLLAELKVDNNTLVLFTSDNGPAMYNWPIDTPAVKP